MLSWVNVGYFKGVRRKCFIAKAGQDRCLSCMQPGYKEDSLKAAQLYNTRQNAQAAIREIKRRNLKKTCFPREYSFVRKGRTEQHPAFGTTEPIPYNLIKIPAFSESLYQLISRQPF